MISYQVSQFNSIPDSQSQLKVRESRSKIQQTIQKRASLISIIPLFLNFNSTSSLPLQPFVGLGLGLTFKNGGFRWRCEEGYPLIHLRRNLDLPQLHRYRLQQIHLRS